MPREIIVIDMYETCYLGKDKIIFVSEEDHAQPSKVEIPEVEDDAEYEGLIKANGEINWECPCLGGMASGVCGEQFRAAFSCFHTSMSEPKGSECIEQFQHMQECFKEYPDIYGEFESIESSETNEDIEDSDKITSEQQFEKQKPLIDEEQNTSNKNTSTSEAVL